MSNPESETFVLPCFPGIANAIATASAVVTENVNAGCRTGWAAAATGISPCGEEVEATPAADTGTPAVARSLFAPLATSLRTRLVTRLIPVGLRVGTYAILLCGALILGFIAVKGAGAITGSFRTTDTFPWFTNTFLTGKPETLHTFTQQGQCFEMSDSDYRRHLQVNAALPPPADDQTHAYAAGGIFPCIVGTLLLTLGAMALALLFGIGSAIYLAEYAKDGRATRLVRLAILNLAGVPSIVFGLFGFGLFVTFFGWNVSLLAGWCTLAIMALPVVITASEEALRAVPQGEREGALALGATHWQAIWKNVLPRALPGLLTSSILTIARIAGETAPVMFTAAYVIRDKLPWEDLARPGDFFFQGVMALPYHIYVISSKIPQDIYSEKAQYGTALVFLLLVMTIASAAIHMRNKLRKQYL